MSPNASKILLEKNNVENWRRPPSSSIGQSIIQIGTALPKAELFLWLWNRLELKLAPHCQVLFQSYAFTRFINSDRLRQSWIPNISSESRSLWRASLPGIPTLPRPGLSLLEEVAAKEEWSISRMRITFFAGRPNRQKSPLVTVWGFAKIVPTNRHCCQRKRFQNEESGLKVLKVSHLRNFFTL